MLAYRARAAVPFAERSGAVAIKNGVRMACDFAKSIRSMPSALTYYGFQAICKSMVANGRGRTTPGCLPTMRSILLLSASSALENRRASLCKAGILRARCYVWEVAPDRLRTSRF